MNIKTQLEETEDIVPISLNLFRGVSNRRTKHVFKLKTDNKKFIEHIKKVLDESDVDWEYFEDDETMISIYE